MKKAFISILGTNDYLECHHSYGDKITESPVKYCQEDTIKIFCGDFDENSEIRVFLTEEAEKKNWFDNGHLDKDKNPIPNKGLKRRLEELHLKSKIISIPIKEGFSEKEIWDIFQVIFESFREDEEVVVDITHSFRSLPMLMITLLNYAKQVKNIKIRGIYYAAFESLGSIQQVKNIPIGQRIVPILNLTSFSELQDWTNATYDFLNYGNVKYLKIINKSKRIASEKKNLDNKIISELLLEIEKVQNLMAFCRGKYLSEYNFSILKEKIISLKNLNTTIVPVNLLIEKFYDKVKSFNNVGVENVLAAVEWCYEHNLYQQSITLLLEMIITSILRKLNYDEKERNYRMIVSSSFTILKNNLKEDQWIGPSKEFPDITKRVLNLQFVHKIKNDFGYLYEIRNDINHSGFTSDPFLPESIKSRLNNSINNVIPKLKEFLSY